VSFWVNTQELQIRSLCKWPAHVLTSPRIASIKAVVDVMRPAPGDSIIDPAAGTGGFLTVAYQWVLDHHGQDMDKDDKRRAREELVIGQELVPETARLCAMNLYLHGIGSEESSPVISGKSSLDAKPTCQYTVVLTNPPYGKKQSFKTVHCKVFAASQMVC
jgi:type I restriction enzyme M protein